MNRPGAPAKIAAFVGFSAHERQTCCPALLVSAVKADPKRPILP